MRPQRTARPYPAPLPRLVTAKDGRTVWLRGARPDDRPAVQRFVRALTERSRRNRFFTPVRELSDDQLQRVTRSRPPQELAIVGEADEGSGSGIVALAQYAMCQPSEAEFAVVVGDAWQRQGLGTRMLSMLAEHAAPAGLKAFAGLVLADNWPMLALLANLDCELVEDRDPHLIRVVKRLEAPGLSPDIS